MPKESPTITKMTEFHKKQLDKARLRKEKGIKTGTNQILDASTVPHSCSHMLQNLIGSSVEGEGQ